jgi:hypothetical protein
MSPLVRPIVRHSLLLSVLTVALLGAAGCGDEIGDSCSISSDCSAQGDRICDRNSPDGYCTILGCDFDTCPEEAICVRFFPAAQTDISCENDTDCTVDELCALGGFCVPRSAEVRYCMKTCGGNGDCRNDYECRDEGLMIAHGGEPVLDPSKNQSELPRFCAPADF